MASDPPLISALRADGYENGFHHWQEEDELIDALGSSRGSIEKLAVQLADRGVDSLVSFVEESWRDSASEADRKKWSKEDLLSSYRDGVIGGLTDRLKAVRARVKAREDRDR